MYTCRMLREPTCYRQSRCKCVLKKRYVYILFSYWCLLSIIVKCVIWCVRVHRSSKQTQIKVQASRCKLVIYIRIYICIITSKIERYHESNLNTTCTLEIWTLVGFHPTMKWNRIALKIRQHTHSSQLKCLWSIVNFGQRGTKSS
jgi:hypothetical protein